MLLFIIFIVIILLILPIFVNIYAYFDTNNKKLYFAITVLGVIKILSGYISARKNGGVYIHIKNKAIIFDKTSIKHLKQFFS